MSSSTMDNKDEFKATRREFQPCAVSKGRARKEAGGHTCRKSQLFFWNNTHEKKSRECVQIDADAHMRRDNRGDGSKRCSEHPSQWVRTRGGHGIDQTELKLRAYKANGHLQRCMTNFAGERGRRARGLPKLRFRQSF